MRKLFVCVAATLMVMAIVVASEPGAPSGTEFNQVVGDDQPGPMQPAPLGQLQPQGQPTDTQGQLGWAVDVWRDSHGSRGIAAGLHGGAGDPGNQDSPAAQDLRNEVLDLVDRRVKLGPGDTWESASFDTSRFTGIGIKVAGEGRATCRTLWRWTADDAPLAEGPEVLVASGAPRTGFGDVLGMEVRIGCEGSSTGASSITDLKLMFRR